MIHRDHDAITPAAAPQNAAPDPARLTRMDMHVHSWASDKPVLPIFGLIDAPECCSEPEAVYEQARARGMDLVTITDHDEIRGAQRLIERGFPGVVAGQEVTVRFPSGGPAVHVLLWGVTPQHHDEIACANLRDDIHDFAHWVRERNLPHSVAHPIDGLAAGRSLARLEQLSLLFAAFELLNGAHPGGHLPTIRAYLDTLTPDRIETLSHRHKIKPVWPQAWRKAVTAGSDDHGLLNIGRTWTGVENPAGAKLACPHEFLRRVMLGGAHVGGQPGHPSLMAHQFVAVAAHRFAKPIAAAMPPRAHMATRAAVRIAGVDIPRPAAAAVALDALKRRAAKLARRTPPSTPIVEALTHAVPAALGAFPEILAALNDPRWRTAPALADHDRAARFADTLFNSAARSIAQGAHQAFERRDWPALKQHADAAGWLLLAQAPYLISLAVHNKERPAMLRLQHETAPLGERPADRPPRVLLFTDTLADINGVSRFIRNVAQQARDTGRELHVFTSTEKRCPDIPTVRNFPPVYAAPMPKYPELDLAVPPALDMLRAASDMAPDVVHVSTPGAVGAVGLAAAAMLRAPVLGVYHTDFPAYIERLFKSERLGRHCARAMGLFYSRFHTVFARSEAYTDTVTRLGVPRKRIKTFTAGIDVEAFHPRNRDQSCWKTLTPKPSSAPRSWSIKALYVGRVSVEKNTPMLSRIWPEIRKLCEARNIEAELVVVGDGPDRERLEASLKGHGAHFLGFRHGEELSRVYASCDCFLFPSVTDTLGQVVMEAQASALPAVVTDQGGPATIVDNDRTGFVLPAANPQRWIDTAVTLMTDPALRARLGREAHHRMRDRGIAASFLAFWQAHEQAWQDHLAVVGAGAGRRSARTPKPDPIPAPY